MGPSASETPEVRAEGAAPHTKVGGPENSAVGLGSFRPEESKRLDPEGHRGQRPEHRPGGVSRLCPAETRILGLLHGLAERTALGSAQKGHTLSKDHGPCGCCGAQPRKRLRLGPGPLETHSQDQCQGLQPPEGPEGNRQGRALTGRCVNPPVVASAVAREVVAGVKS